MIDLTLDSLLIPDILGYTPPFGTKIATTAQNKGGLSTQQVNDNILLPFEKQRAVVVEASDTTSKVEYDARLIVSGDGITVTVPSESFAGCVLSVLSPAGTNHLNINSTSYTLVAGQPYSFMFSGAKWMPDCPYPVNGVYTQYPQQEPPAKLWIGTTWEELNFSGAFFRATGGNAQAFIEKTDVLKNRRRGCRMSMGRFFLGALKVTTSRNLVSLRPLMLPAPTGMLIRLEDQAQLLSLTLPRQILSTAEVPMLRQKIILSEFGIAPLKLGTF